MAGLPRSSRQRAIVFSQRGTGQWISGTGCAAAPPAALDQVTARASGPPLEPALRLTLDFHPDRASTGLPILESPARDGGAPPAGAEAGVGAGVGVELGPTGFTGGG
ncbi:hypothetical protein GCM10017687_74270 [Streptomyces echinatus]